MRQAPELAAVMALDRPLVITGGASRVGFPPPRDRRLARPFLALRFGRIVNPRLRTKAADLLEKAHREHNAWRATHIAAIARRDVIFQAFGRRLVLNELTLET